MPGHGYYFASLPPYCTVLYWEGTGFYFADDVYYEWNGTAGGYQEVEPPAGLVQLVDSQKAIDTDLFVFPVEGQTNVQLKADQESCDVWAGTQSGFAPRKARPPNQATGDFAARRDGYLRAVRLCLEARHYAVE